MSDMRPECHHWSLQQSIGQEVYRDRRELIELTLKAVNKRRSLSRGKLDADDGKHCAMGCFWIDHPRALVKTRFIDEIARINDAKSDRETPKARWKRVQKWLRDELAALE